MHNFHISSSLFIKHKILLAFRDTKNIDTKNVKKRVKREIHVSRLHTLFLSQNKIDIRGANSRYLLSCSFELTLCLATIENRGKIKQLHYALILIPRTGTVIKSAHK